MTNTKTLFAAVAVSLLLPFGMAQAWGGGPDEKLKIACDHLAMLAATGLQSAAAGDGPYAENMIANAAASQAATAAWTAMKCGDHKELVDNYREWINKRFTAPEPKP